MENGTNKYRAWLFTYYGEGRPTTETLGCEYLCVQQERCPTTGRLHWQGYGYWRNPRTRGGLARLLPGAHWENRRGSHEQAVAYCSKEESRVAGPYTTGSAPEQGRRTDISSFAEAILAGRPDIELVNEFPAEFLRFGKYRHDVRMAAQSPRTWKTQVVVIHGPSGCGKSRWAHERWPEAYTKDPTNDWWDGYQGQQVVVLDEFYGAMRHDAMLKLMDRYQLRVQVKGGYVNFIGRLIIITSNADPREWYVSTHTKFGESRIAFFRRVDHEITYTNGNWYRNRNAGRTEPELIDDPGWEPIDLNTFRPEGLQGEEESGSLHTTIEIE